MATLTAEEGGGSGLRMCLGPQLLVLRLAGGWSPSAAHAPSPSRLGPTRLYGAYSAGVVVTLLAFVASQVSAARHFWGDLLNVTMSTCLMFTYSMAIVKVIAFLKMRRSAEQLIRELNTSMEHFGRRVPGAALVYAGCKAHSRRVSAGHVGIGFVAYCFWVGVPAAMGRRCRSDDCRATTALPAVVWCPFPFTQSPNYEVVYAAVSVAMFYGYILTTTLDAFFYSLIIYTAGQLRVLNLMARDVCAAGGPRQASARLADCVNYHIHIERCVQRLGTLVGPIVLGQFIADIVTISAAMFVATATDADYVWLLKFSSYLLAIAEQLFLYCWFGSDVSTESERLQLSAYSSDWPGMPARFQRDLCILLSRGHRPLRLAAYKFYTISRETFLLLMNTAFSYYAVLRQLHTT